MQKLNVVMCKRDIYYRSIYFFIFLCFFSDPCIILHYLDYLWDYLNWIALSYLKSNIITDFSILIFVKKYYF